MYKTSKTAFFSSVYRITQCVSKENFVKVRNTSNEWVTLLLCANMDSSDKIRPIMIQKSIKPKFFAKVKSFPIDYVTNRKVQMTSADY